MFPRPLSSRFSMTPYLCALGAALLTAALAMPLRHLLDLANIVMLFLLAVFLVALRLGRGPAVATAVASVTLFDYLIVPPHMGFIPTDAQYLVTLAVMLAVALVTAQLAAGVHEQANIARSGERRARRLYQLARDSAGASSLLEVQGALDAFLAETGCHATLYLMDEELRPSTRPMDELVQEAIERDQPVGMGRTLVLPLSVPSRKRGVMVVVASEEAPDPGQEHDLFVSVASLMSIAVERLHYGEVAQKTQLQVEAERLRGSILTALSHDLRTPLTALVGLADSLLLDKGAMEEAIRQRSLAIRDQALAMNNLLGNLLDMARLQGGKAALRKEWHLLDDLISSALRHFKLSQFNRPVKVRIDPGLPLVEFDAVLMERVVWNLLENAAKYAPDGMAVEVNAYVEGNFACMRVCDRGPGFPPNRIDELFEMFVRGNPESSKPGVGLGLAICRTVVDAHGGTITAENRSEGGACVTIRLPLGTPPEIHDEESEEARAA